MPIRNIAKDATVTLVTGGADDGAFTTVSSITLKYRTVNADLRNTLVDCTAANDDYVYHRIGHRDYTVVCEGLVHNSNTTWPDMMAAAFANDLAKFTILISGGGKTLNFDGMVETAGLRVDMPDLETLTIRPGYGTAPTLT